MSHTNLSALDTGDVGENTLRLAQQLCTAHFQIPPQGLQRVRDAIRGTPGNRESSPPTNHSQTIIELLRTESGTLLLAVCAVIGQYFQETSFLENFFEELYSRSTGTEKKKKKDTHNWCQLREFDGLLWQSGFVGIFNDITAAALKKNVETGTLVTGVPSLIIDAFECMTRQACEGETTRVVMYMGADGGYVAAVAYWLFDLDVVLQQNGRVVIPHVAKVGDHPRITVDFCDPPSPCT